MTNNKSDTNTGPPHNEGAKQPVITLDYALYQHYLDDADLTQAQKQEFLDTLWHIIVSFVDLGFGVHPLQQAQEEQQQGLIRAVDTMDSQCATTVINPIDGQIDERT